jgi:hypothetical protein
LPTPPESGAAEAEIDIETAMSAMTQDRIPTPNAQAVLEDQTHAEVLHASDRFTPCFLRSSLIFFADDAFRLRINVKNAAEGQPHSKVVEPVNLNDWASSSRGAVAPVSQL